MKLQEIYAPHNTRLFEYLGYSIPEWPSVVNGDQTALLKCTDEKATDPSSVVPFVAGDAITTTATPPPPPKSKIMLNLFII